MRRKRRGATPPPAHDRRITDLPYGSLTASSVEDDPYAKGDKIVVLRSIRDDPLAGLLARGHIDKAQFEAGRCWQRHYERAGVGAVIAIDPTKEPVDGRGAMRPDIRDSQLDAFKQLNAAAMAVGPDDHWIVVLVLGQGRALKSLVYDGSEMEIKSLGRRLRKSLEVLAMFWGFVSNGEKGRRT